MALVSADSRIAELLGELHQLIKQTQEERSRSEHNLVNIQKTHERMQTENKISPYYRTKLRGLYTTAKADAEAECNILRKDLDKIAEIKSLLEERRIAAKIAGLYNDSEPPRKTMRRGVLMTLLQQSAMTLPLWIGKPGEKPPPLCGAIPASSDYVAKPGDKVAARVKAVEGDEQWILAEAVSYNHATNKERKEKHRRRKRGKWCIPAQPGTEVPATAARERYVCMCVREREINPDSVSGEFITGLTVIFSLLSPPPPSFDQDCSLTSPRGSQQPSSPRMACSYLRHTDRCLWASGSLYLLQSFSVWSPPPANVRGGGSVAQVGLVIKKKKDIPPK
uniref:SAGA complex associated factor 29 n=1 Tax=Laticauda laticaudata TaxID=8630 RepID=A0A8C5R9B0_LATLA